MMIILHNSLDKESRNFVAVHGAGATVFDWYKGGREAFWALGHTHGVSAFPSIIIDVPMYRTAKAIVNSVVIPSKIIPRRQYALRKPANIDAVVVELDRLNIELAKSAGEGLPVAPLTLANMSDVKT